MTVSTIGLLLLGPILKSFNEESKKPTVVILQDISNSISDWVESSGQAFLDLTSNDYLEPLLEDYSVDVFEFGEGVTLSDRDSSNINPEVTNISDALEYVHDIYEGENLGAIILATDGIYNQGKNPLYSPIPANIPIYSVALGDTSQRRDLFVQTVLHNEVAYLNDEMLTQVDIRAFNAANQNVRLRVEKQVGDNYVTVSDQNITITSDDFFKTTDVQLAFDQVGINHYRYSLTRVNNEINTANNRKDIYIEVLDARQKIGIIAESPHPDVSALKQVLEFNKNYEVTSFFADPSPSEIRELDFVIFHELPMGKRNLRSIHTILNDQKTPRIYVLGGEAQLNLWNQLQPHIVIKGSRGNTNDAQAEINESFTNFTYSEELKNRIIRFPPLASPFGEYQVNGNVDVLLYQSIGGISTDFPLVAFAESDGIKNGYILGRDIWRWKLFDYLQHQNFNVVTELLDKVSIYISTKDDKRKFRVNSSNNLYYTNENISFQAELYNDNYELVNAPDIGLQLYSSDGIQYEYAFSRSGNSYTLDVGKLSSGSYSYRSEVIFNGEQYQAEGRFVVREVQFELYDLQARHNVLYALSDKTGGMVIYPDEVEEIRNEIIDRNPLKPIIYQNAVTKSFLDFKSLFFLIFGFLVLEWTLRRYFGSL